MTTLIKNKNDVWMLEGRFFPLALVISFGAHAAFVNHETAYRVYILAIVLIDLALFYCLLRGWKVSSAIAQLVVMSAALLMQMRLLCDPILAFAAMLPILAAMWLATLICLQRYLNAGRQRWLIVSAALLTASLITYEISYTLFPILFGMVYLHQRSWRAAVTTVRFHAAAITLLIAFVLGLRHNVQLETGHPYKPHLEASAIVRTAFNQTTSALPFTYDLSKKGRYFVDGKRLLTRWDNWAMFLAAGALTVSLLKQCRKDGINFEVPAGTLAVCGIGMWVLPGLPITLSPKYQDWVKFGLAYLPVYIQYFGVALLFAGILQWLARAFPKHAKVAAGLLVALNACVAMVHYDTGREVAKRFARDKELVNRYTLEAALRTGLGVEVPEGATVWETNARHWMSGGPALAGGHLTQCLNLRINAVVGPAAPGWLADPARFSGIAAPTFALNETCTDAKNGYVALYAIDSTGSATTGGNLNTRSVRVFVKGSFRELAEKGDRLMFVAKSCDSTGDSQRLLDFSHMTLVRRGPEGSIYQGTFNQAAEVASVTLVESPSVASLSRIGSLDAAAKQK